MHLSIHTDQYIETFNEGNQINAFSVCKCTETPTDLFFCAILAYNSAKE